MIVIFLNLQIQVIFQGIFIISDIYLLPSRSMPVSPQSFQSSTSQFQQSLNTKLQKLIIFALGRNNYLNIRDLKYVFDRDLKSEEFKSTQQEEVYRKSIEKNISTYLAVGAVSSIGMNFLVQKIWPKFSSATVGKLLLDVGIASLCIGTGLYLSLNAIQPDLAKIKKMYFEHNDRHFLHHLRRQGPEYGISMETQIKRFLNQKEYDVWDASGGIVLLDLVQ